MGKVALTYRDVGGGSRTFAQWLNDLRSSSGVYVIRSKSSKVTLYVGESHTGRLADTIKRHFYAWGDHQGRKHFTSDPSRVQVAVRTMPPGAAPGHQDRLIRRLNPRHNRSGFDNKDVPF